jgi:glucose/arabinose dehydrogenase
VGTLANGASAVVTINVTPNAAGQITNTASVTGAQADPDTANNTASVSTVVDPQAAAPLLLDQNLSVKTIVSGLNQPTSLAFLGANEFFVLERATGKVQRVLNGQLQPTALDLAVNNASERGLLGIALHPNFPATPYVYLYWTESSTGVDTSNTDDVALLGNRVDRFVWNGQALALDRNLIRLRALQADAGQPSRGNHNGGVLRFGPDGKLYILMGDNGRRGFLQNITNGTVPDDQFGGPEPDDAHLTGVILRLNDDGSIPADNPFFNANAGLTGQAATNIKKIYAYGVRNGFGMAFDPLSGQLWTQENGDDAFDEINRVTPGFNGGWIQVMGPSVRIGEYKSIEVNRPGGLQQNRWSPTLIADAPSEALLRLYSLPGSHYAEPEFSWKYAVAPSPIGFVKGKALGAQFEGDLFVGASRTTLYNGYLFRLRLSTDRLKIAMTDPRLQDKVADNLDKFDITESESLLIGKNFGVTTDIQTGLDGNLYVVSLSNGAVYQIYATATGQQSTASSAAALSGDSILWWRFRPGTDLK